MNPKSEIWRRAAVVTFGTTAAVVLASATVAVLPFSHSDSAVLRQQSLEAGFVDLPRQGAPTAGARHTAQVVRPPPPPPPESPKQLAPESAPIPTAQESPPVAHEPERPTPPAPQENAKPASPPSTPTDQARKQELKGEPNATERWGVGTGAAGAIYKPTPIIPPELRRHALNAVAIVRFTIATDGSVTVQLQQGTADPDINQVLMDTFRRWRFFPAMQGGKPVVSTLVLRVPIKVE